MPSKDTKRLADLHTKATADGQWPLAAAAHAILADESNLDLQINVVGALHEAGSLRNRIEPFWKMWRTDAAAWAARCVERQRKGDRDYWSVAALLGLDIRAVWPVCKKAGYRIMSVRAVPPLTNPLTHYLTLAVSHDDVWCPAIELGWEAKTGVLLDAARWRAIIFDEMSKKGASVIGKGTGSHFLRAALPYGSWRVESMDFELVPEAVIPIEKTVLKKA